MVARQLMAPTFSVKGQTADEPPAVGAAEGGAEEGGALGPRQLTKSYPTQVTSNSSSGRTSDSAIKLQSNSLSSVP